MTFERLATAIAMAGTLSLGACSSPAQRDTGSASAPAAQASGAPAVSTARGASVVLAPASGSLVSGRLDITPTADGVRLSGEIGGLAPNSTHALHIHEKGDCSAADATSAGGHFNPGAQPHGRSSGAAHHAGDMDNVVADGEGVARVEVQARGVTLGGGAANDVANRAVIVHAQADDYTTQPTGNAGGRVACGVIGDLR